MTRLPLQPGPETGHYHSGLGTENATPDGSSFPLTADVSADGHTISDLADPVADGDAVPKSYVDGLGGGAVGIAAVTLTSAQIKALNATPVQLAAAPGAGKAYMILSVMTQAIPGTTPFGVSGDARLEVGGEDQVLADYSTWETGKYENAGNDSAKRALNGSGSDDMALIVNNQEVQTVPLFPSTLIDNQPLVIGNPGHDFDGGRIVSAVVADPGSGYAPGDTFSIPGQAGGGAAGEVDTVDGGGGVLTFTVTNPGSAGASFFTGYGNPRPTTKDMGAGDDLLTITVTDTEEGDGQLRVFVAYAVVDLA